MAQNARTPVEQAAQAAVDAQRAQEQAALAAGAARAQAVQAAQATRAQAQAEQAEQAAQRAYERANQAAQAAQAAAQAAAKAAQPDQAALQAQKARSEAERATQAMEAARAAEAQAAQARASQTPADDGPARAVYTTEYEGGAKRYEDIYKAIWQNFSYMAVLAGAILTFGKDSLGTEGAAFIACLPLLLWFWATFEPLNKYGDDVVKRLSDLEKTLNQLVFGNPAPPNGANDTLRGISHFTGFHTRGASNSSNEKPNGLTIFIGLLLIAGVIGIKIILDSNQYFVRYLVAVGALILLGLIILSLCELLRVRTTMRMFVLLIHLLAIWLGYGWLSASGIEVTVTSVGAQDRKIQVALPFVPAIEPEKLGRSQKATVVVPVKMEVTMTPVDSKDSKNRSLQLELPPATVLELIAPPQKARLIIEP